MSDFVRCSDELSRRKRGRALTTSECGEGRSEKGGEKFPPREAHDHFPHSSS
jgi:hypothetical protein